MRVRSAFRVSHLILAGLLVVPTVTAQEPASADPNEARVWLTKELNYLNLRAKLSDAEMNRLVELRVQSLNTADKEKAIAGYKEMWSKIISLYGPTAMRPEVLERNLNGMATRLVNQPASTGGEPWPAGTTPLGNLGKVVKKGRGPIPMVLIPPVGFDEAVYEAFMARNAERYTMYAVTPAGFGGTPPPPRPERLDLEKLTLWSGFEQGILKLIAAEKLDRPVIAGMVGGAYAAAHMALVHPERFRAAILLNGMLVSPMTSPADPTRSASLEERRRLAPMRFNFGLTLPLSGVTVPRRSPEATENFLKTANAQTLLASVLINTRNEERGRELFRHVRLQAHPEASYGFNIELLATDLTESFARLKVPTLAIPSMSDDLWTSGASRTNYVQWAEIKERHPQLPLTIAPFYDTRMFPTEDSPAEVDAAIADFLAGRPVAGKEKKIFTPQASPRARAQHALGSGFVEVHYARPAVKGRNVWGELVPYDKVWRAGANEATTVTFPVDVMVQGQALPKGTYSFFAIPGKDEWTLIFNRILHQWGAFTYNSEFDALRVKVSPRPATRQEWLQFMIEPAADGGLEIALRWAELEVPFRVVFPSSEAKRTD